MQPTITTPRLTLRAIQSSDLIAIHQMRTDPAMIFHTDSKLDANEEETSVYMAKMEAGVEQGKWYLWAIDLEGKLIGSISLWNFDEKKTQAELGYGIVPQHQNNGYMKECIAAVVTFAFDSLALSMVEAYTENSNVASKHALVANGFAWTKQVVDAGYYVARDFLMDVYQLRNGS